MVDANAFIADKTILVVITNDNYSATRGQASVKPWGNIQNAQIDGKMAELCMSDDK